MVKAKRRAFSYLSLPSVASQPLPLFRLARLLQRAVVARARGHALHDAGAPSCTAAPAAPRRRHSTWAPERSTTCSRARRSRRRSRRRGRCGRAPGAPRVVPLTSVPSISTTSSPSPNASSHHTGRSPCSARYGSSQSRYSPSVSRISSFVCRQSTGSPAHSPAASARAEHLAGDAVEERPRARIERRRQVRLRLVVEALQDLVRDVAERERRRLLVRLLRLAQVQHAVEQEDERARRVRLELARGPDVLGAELRLEALQHARVAQLAVPGVRGDDVAAGEVAHASPRLGDRRDDRVPQRVGVGGLDEVARVGGQPEPRGGEATIVLRADERAAAVVARLGPFAAGAHRLVRARQLGRGVVLAAPSATAAAACPEDRSCGT